MLLDVVAEKRCRRRGTPVTFMEAKVPFAHGATERVRRCCSTLGGHRDLFLPRHEQSARAIPPE